MRKYKTIFTVVVISCLFLTNCDFLFAKTIFDPWGKPLDAAKKLGLRDWISVVHYGPQDRSPEQFVIAFSTVAKASVSLGVGLVTIIRLPKREMAPMVEFAKANSSDTATYDWGTYAVTVYYKTVVKQKYMMETDNSIKFFNYLDANLRKHQELSDKTKSILPRIDRIIEDLTRMKKSSVK